MMNALLMRLKSLLEAMSPLDFNNSQLTKILNSLSVSLSENATPAGTHSISHEERELRRALQLRKYGHFIDDPVIFETANARVQRLYIAHPHLRLLRITT